MENEQETIDSQNDTETTENETEAVAEETTPEQIDVEALRKENETLKAQKDHWRKKAEEKPKALPPQIDGLTGKDVLALSGEGITQEEDVEFAEKWSKFNGKSMSDTLKDATFKAVMSQRQEERKTAGVTQTRGGPKGVSKVSGDELLRKAAKNEFPESEDDINKMLDAKFEAKKKANKRD